MKKLLRKSCFTLVEVLIAMGICVVGVVSIMVLFPVGANASRDANMAFYADQAADQMLHFTKFIVLKDSSEISGEKAYVIFKALTGWSDLNSPGDATTKPGDAEPDWSAVDYFGEDETNPAFTAVGDYIENSYMTMLVNSGTRLKCNSLNLFRMSFITQIDMDEDNHISDDENLEDFACVVRLWVTPVHVDELDDTSVKLPRAATFNIEVSWPADIAYDHRQKAEYSLDVFVPES
ncbi:MAG: hypothetical protein II943_10625 [Victivallales bacterium]|nr:hypothetical protein [Victivallales bacterium]